MKQLEAMYAWNPETEDVTVGPWPDETGWSERFEPTEGACMAELRGMPSAARLARLIIEFHTCIVRNGIPAYRTHDAFLAIDEYRVWIAPDTPEAG